MKIYTRTGDQGKTSLVGGQRVSKTCTRLESYGTIDELCSHIGLLVTYCTDTHDCEFLMAIQGQLFVVGGYLATDTSQRDVHPGNIVKEEMVASLEQEIDVINATLPPSAASFFLADAELPLCATYAAPYVGVPNAAFLP